MHGYAHIALNMPFICCNFNLIDGSAGQGNSKNPSQHEVVLASGSAAWNIIGYLRRQKLMVRRIPSNGVSFVLLVDCNDQFFDCSVYDHQLAELDVCFLNCNIIRAKDCTRFAEWVHNP